MTTPRVPARLFAADSTIKPEGWFAVRYGRTVEIFYAGGVPTRVRCSSVLRVHDRTPIVEAAIGQKIEPLTTEGWELDEERPQTREVAAIVLAPVASSTDETLGEIADPDLGEEAASTGKKLAAALDLEAWRTLTHLRTHFSVKAVDALAELEQLGPAGMLGKDWGAFLKLCRLTRTFHERLVQQAAEARCP